MSILTKRGITSPNWSRLMVPLSGTNRELQFAVTVRWSLSENRSIACDGCLKPVRSRELSFRRADGREARYCGSCDADYQRWQNVCLAEEARLNALLDIFLEESRNKLNLVLVPQDLPPVNGIGTLR